MNSQQLRALKADVECPVCYTGLGDRILPCAHSFCFSCLRQLVEPQQHHHHQQQQQELQEQLPQHHDHHFQHHHQQHRHQGHHDPPAHLSIRCPTCRAVKQLTVDPSKASSIDDIIAHAIPVNLTARHVAQALANVEWCSTHEDSPVEFWCFTCAQALCQSCHGAHPHTAGVETLVNAHQQLHQQLTIRLAAIQAADQLLSERLQQQKETTTQILSQIEEAFDAAVDRLQRRRTQLRSQVLENGVEGLAPERQLQAIHERYEGCLREGIGKAAAQTQVTAAVVQQQMQFLLQLPKVESIPPIPQVKFVPWSRGVTLGQVQVSTLKRPGPQSSRDRLVDAELQLELEEVALGGGRRNDDDDMEATRATGGELKEKRRKR